MGERGGGGAVAEQVKAKNTILNIDVNIEHHMQSNGAGMGGGEGGKANIKLKTCFYIQ